jgi:hypothetical protein
MRVRLPKSRWAGVAISLAVVAAVAGITLGVITLLGVTFQGSGEAQQPPGAQRVEGPLLTANRDRLAICVDAVGSAGDFQIAGGAAALEASAKSTVEAALTDVAKHPQWESSGLGLAPPLVDIGCPSPPAVLRPGVEIEQMGKGRIFVLPFPCVEEASSYAEFVFILPPAEIERVFGKDPELTLADQETFCGEGGSVGVTGGLYLTPADLDDVPTLAEKLERAIGVWYPSEW